MVRLQSHDVQGVHVTDVRVSVYNGKLCTRIHIEQYFTQQYVTKWNVTKRNTVTKRYFSIRWNTQRFIA
jgi:hypothetical protein